MNHGQAGCRSNTLSRMRDDAPDRALGGMTACTYRAGVWKHQGFNSPKARTRIVVMNEQRGRLMLVCPHPHITPAITTVRRCSLNIRALCIGKEGCYPRT